MPAIELEDIAVIPASVTDRESFNRWALSPDFPDRGRFAFLYDRVWVDLEMEAEDHNWLKNIVAAVLTTLTMSRRSGRFYADRMMFSNRKARISTEPDGMYVSNDTRRSGRIKVRGAQLRRAQGVILEGTPDMVLEVVSPSSVRKDTVVLFNRYWRAGISEYWIIDASGDRPQFTIYSHGVSGYRAARAVDGWRKSSVFGAAFRLTQSTDELGLPLYQLEMR